LLDSLIALKTFVLVASMTALTLAAAVEERDHAWKRIGTLNRELEAFNYSIAHDLRGPLRRIDALGETLARHPERSGPLTARIHEAVQRMATLIDSLLRLSGLEYADLADQRVDLTSVARQAADTLAASDPRRQARFRIAEHLEARGDPDLLGVLVWNLLENAWKFTSRRALADIEVGSRGEGRDGPVFFVRDNGAGFDAAHAGSLFKPFRRLHGRSEFPGSGIGLAMAQRVVERHGGRIWADAAVDEGASFYFTLSPRRIDHEQKAHLVGGRRS
jgi:signal transduction histidine kinase